MNEIALAVQALSACDRLEQGVKDGDKESMEAVRAMVARWAGEDYDNLQNVLAQVFRFLMQKWSSGSHEDLAMAMMFVRCFVERQVAKVFGNEDEPEEPA